MVGRIATRQSTAYHTGGLPMVAVSECVSAAMPNGASHPGLQKSRPRILPPTSSTAPAIAATKPVSTLVSALDSSLSRPPPPSEAPKAPLPRTGTCKRARYQTEERRATAPRGSLYLDIGGGWVTGSLGCAWRWNFTTDTYHQFSASHDRLSVSRTSKKQNGSRLAT